MYLNMISISGVQDFINKSTKPKELENSSNFVSEFIHELMKKIKKIEIIYPCKENSMDLIGIGNTIVYISDKEIIQAKIDILTQEIMKEKDISTFPLDLYCTSTTYEEDKYEKNYEQLIVKLLFEKYNRSRELFDLEEEHEFSKEYEIFFKSKNKDNLLSDMKKIFDVSQAQEITTSHIALGDYLEGKEELRTELERLDEEIKKDGENDLFDSLVAGKVKYDKKTIEVSQKIYQINNSVNEIKETIEYSKISSLKYFAIYRLDIDNMGEKIGKLEKEKQKKLSSNIINFMEKAFGFYKEFDSYKKFIYAGGDDLLLLLPVEFCLKFAKELKTEFLNIFGESQTYTQGIFIIGSKNDFSECLRNSSKFMKKAKKYSYKKNHTVISIVSEGYSTRESYFRNDKYDIFMELKDYFRDKSAVIYQELDKNIGFFRKEYGIFEGVNGIILNEQKRLLKRKVKEKYKNKINDIEEKLEEMMFFDGKLNYENYINLLSIVKFLNKGKGL